MTCGERNTGHWGGRLPLHIKEGGEGGRKCRGQSANVGKSTPNRRDGRGQGPKVGVYLALGC